MPPINDDQSLAASIASIGDTQSYTFTAQAGDLIKAFVDNLTGGRVQIQLLDSDGVTVLEEQSSPLNARDAGIGLTSLPFAIAATGQYTLVVAGVGNTTGNYTVGLTNFTENAQTIADNQVVASSLDFAGDGEAYTFTAQSGDLIEAFVDNLTGGRVRIRLLDANGVTVLDEQSSPLNARDVGVGELTSLPFAIASTGQYTLLVDGVGDATGNYTVGLTNFTENAQTIADNQVVTSSLDFAGDGEAYTFTAQTGDLIEAFVDNLTGGRVRIRLLDANGVTVLDEQSSPLNARDVGVGELTSLPFAIASTGQYTLLVDGVGDATGNYTVGLTNFTENSQIIADNQVVTSSLDFAGDGEAYTFTAQAGDLIEAFVDNLTGGRVRIRLLDANGVTVLDEQSSPLNARDVGVGELTSLPFAIASTGQYTLLVDGVGDATGNYTVGLTNFTENSQIIADNQVVTSSLDFAGDGEAYTFTAQSGDLIEAFVDNLTGGRVRIRLLDANGVTVLDEQSSPLNARDVGVGELTSLPFAIASTGQYTLLVDGVGDATGNYTVGLTNFTENAQTIADNQVVASSLDFAGDGEAYTFTAQSGDLIEAFVDNLTGGRVRIRLLDANGTTVLDEQSSPLNARDVSIENFQIQNAGTYTLLVDGVGDTTGNYILNFGGASSPSLSLSISPNSISENGGIATATLTRNSTIGDLTVDLASNDVTEASVPAQVTILDGQNSVQFAINGVDDVVVDGNQLVMISASAIGFSNTSSTLIITDDDIAPPPTADIDYAIATSAVTLTEGDSGAQQVTFTITRTEITQVANATVTQTGTGAIQSTSSAFAQVAAAQAASSIDFTIGGTATNTEDFNNIGGTSGASGLTGTINFGVGETSKTITLDVLGDTTVEPDETIVVSLANATAPSTATISTATATTTILNDDVAPPPPADIDYAIETSAVTVTEGDSGAQQVTFTVTRTGATQDASSIDFTIGGTATNTEDFNNISGTSGASGLTGTINFGADETSKTITLDVLGDTDIESDETIIVSLANGTASGTATISTDTATTTILNDDVAPPPPADIDYAIATSAATVTEGDSGAQQVTFTVTRTGATQDASSIDFTLGGTATNTEDFNNIGGSSGASGLTGTINFGADETSQTITLDVLGDTDIEPDETVVVSLANATAPGTATISADSAITTILNDDTAPPPPADIDYAIATSAVTVTEGDSGSQQVTFTVTRTGATQDASSIDFTLGGTATNTEDFNNISGTSGASGLTGTINFGADETSQTITLDVLGDTDIESDETVVVSLLNATASGIATISTDTATTTILNDDVAPPPPTDIDYAIATSAVTVTEGDSGAQQVTFTVTRTGATQDASSIDFTLGGTAINSEDFNNIGGSSGASGLTGTINFGADETSKTITLDVLGDTDIEPDETVVVSLSNATAPGTATISTDSATTTILNDDAPPPPPADIDYAIATSAVTVTERDSGAQQVAFTVTRTGATQDASSIDFSFGGTAINSEDFNNIGGSSGASGLTGTINFGADETSKTITLDVLGDTTIEPDETIIVSLTNGTALGTATISTDSATTTILNDDTAPPPPADIDYAIATSAVTVTEGDSGAQQVTFTVTRTGATQDASSIDFTLGGTATNAEDFNNIGGSSGASGLTGTINFGADETSKTITLDVLGDTTIESDETIIVSLANGTASGTATISTDSAITTILNDDAPPPPLADIDYSIATSAVSLTEGDNGAQQVTFTVTRTGSTQNASSVDFTFGGTATNSEDFNNIGGTSGAAGLTGTINFGVDETSKTITLDVLGDTHVEPDETIVVSLANATAPGTATISTDSATTTILNDDFLNEDNDSDDDADESNENNSGDGEENTSSGKVLHGTHGHDRLVGMDGDDTIRGLRGDDLLLGRGGDDHIQGNGGEDTLKGGSGDDELLGGHGRDYLLGGDGHDLLRGGNGKDLLVGGAGSDTFVLEPGKGRDVIADFDGAVDKVSLMAEQLSFDDLKITSVGHSSLVSVASTGDQLAFFTGVGADLLNANVFMVIENPRQA
ncbi:Calx-beta domain-containing protein [Acaryochloris marina]|uniref:Calx-beta domain-containing protein n=1 Tax=Acaryochloris marina TaxID=155978 RepID=UPI001BB04807|nr:Calx-beta domain-containing protein [Acaryochloris marina]QUY41438.1 hypothetical protein I1H34_19555 [Acaryochloris marina S15]